MTVCIDNYNVQMEKNRLVFFPFELTSKAILHRSIIYADENPNTLPRYVYTTM